MTLHHTFN